LDGWLIGWLVGSQSVSNFLTYNLGYLACFCAKWPTGAEVMRDTLLFCVFPITANFHTT